ncbi:MAG: hypothetical protein AAFQ68_13960 [Bacteroidota bacterium]
MICVGTFVLIFVSLLIYGSAKSDNWQTIAYNLRSLKPSEIEKMVIQPKNPDWPINLSLETITITDQAQIAEILPAIQSFVPQSHRKVPNRDWEMRLRIIPKDPNRLKLKNPKSITLKFKDLESGLFFEMTRVMGYQTFKCPDRLSEIFEEIADYRGPVGSPR